jgi:maltose O-acetyltransferase
MDEADVFVGDDVWIGAAAIILPGVTIGNGAIIGAGAVVHRDVPAMSVAVGDSARVVGQRNLPVAEGRNQ